MENREENYFGFIGTIKNFSQTLFLYVGDLVRLAKLESQLAKRTLLRICMLSVIAFIITITIWFGIFVFITLYLEYLGLSLLSSLGITIGINILLLASIAFSILKLRHNLYFPATRKQLSFKKKDK